MKIKKPYIVTESEKERIRGLHNNVKNLLREDSSEDESYRYGKDMGHDDKELYDLKHDGGGHIHVDDLEDDIHYDDEHDWGTDEDYELEESLYDDARREFPNHPWEDKVELNEAPYCPGGCPEECDCVHSGKFGSCDCGLSDWDNAFSGGRKAEPSDGGDREQSNKMEMGETALPTGWTMRTQEEIEEENIMDDLYEVWSGHEDDKALRESMVDDGTIEEQWYELPLRFGNKRLTESQLLRMIDTIIK